MYQKIARRMRARRNERELQFALRSSSPGVRQDLLAAAAHQQHAQWLH
jgi:hypothetical protein